MATDDPKMKRKVFLSFALEDKPVVDRIRRKFEKDISDLEFLDFSIRVSPDDDWRQKVDQFIRESDAIFCIVGERTHESAPVTWEIERSAELGKPILAFVLNNVTRLPSVLTGLAVVQRPWKSNEVRSALELVSA